MRLRVTSKPPLPTLKIWYNVNDSRNFAPATTIFELKEQLCSRVFPSASVNSQELSLSIDEFELLDDSDLSVLREDDLLCVSSRSLQPRCAPQPNVPPAPFTKKRKRSDTSPKPRSRVPIVRPTWGHESTSSSETSSESSSSSMTSSDSSSSEESDSEDDSGPEEVATLKAKLDARLEAQLARLSAQALQPPVPPGFGKPSTKSRNQRRRIKRKHDLLGTSIMSEVSESTLPQLARLDARGPTIENAVADDNFETSVLDPGEGRPNMMSLRNKNKKKGFYNLGQRPIPPRIVFSEESSPAIAIPKMVAANGSTMSHPPQLVAPSEKQQRGEIPSNIFVTSVDVEAGMWDVRRKHPSDPAINEVSEEYMVMGKDNTYHNPLQMIEFDAIESQWETLPSVVEKANLKVGSVAVWKELGINPLSFTPEMLPVAVRITRINQDTVTAKRIIRPGSDQVSFGTQKDDYEKDEESADFNEMMMEDEEEFEWTSVISQGWKILVN